MLYLVVVVSELIGFVPVVSTGVVATVSVEGVDLVDESLLMVGEVDMSDPVDFSGEWQPKAAIAKKEIKTMLFMKITLIMKEEMLASNNEKNVPRGDKMSKAIEISSLSINEKQWMSLKP